MSSSTKHLLGIVLLALCSLGSGWVVPRDSQPVEVTVSEGVILTEAEVWARRRTFRRQNSDNCALDISDPDTPLCRPLCAVSSFSCANYPVGKRSVTDERSSSLYSPATYYGWSEVAAFNRTIDSNDPGAEVRDKHRLSKRAFTQVLQGQIATYLPNQFNEHYDAYFGVPTALVVDGDTDDTTVVDQIQFTGNAFQVGSAGLHGCTVVTIVSARAVYMGHFWEIGAWSSGTTAFSQRVLNFFSGTGTRAGQGPGFNPGLFNGANDNTRVFIMTPRKGVSNPQSSNYRSKVPQLISTIQAALTNQGVPLALYNYIPLEYSNPTDSAQINQNQRGIALFQFDPNGRPSNTPGWRLFYEQHQFQDTDPAPGVASAAGIPDI